MRSFDVLLLSLDVLLLSLVVDAFAQDTSTCSLSGDFRWQLLRNCAAECIWGTCCISVADFIGCPDPWYNECVCNIKQQSAAGIHVSTCISSRCGGDAGIATAVEVYFDYCSSAGYAVTTTVTALPTLLDYSTVSLFNDNEFKVLRSCEQECIWGTCCISVADIIGCNSPWYNGCVCDLNMQSAAASHVSSYVSSRCTGTSDVSTAAAVYLDYCASAGYVLARSPQPPSVTDPTPNMTEQTPSTTRTTSSTAQQTSSTTEQIVTSTGAESVDTRTTMTTSAITAMPPFTPPNTQTTETQTSTDPSSTAPATDSGKEYTTSDKIALGVGIGLGLPTLLATLWACIRREIRTLAG
jgi:hypothetical protein